VVRSGGPKGGHGDCLSAYRDAGAKPSLEEVMSKHTRVSHPIYYLLPTEIEGFDSLSELALDSE
jgi:hypothetical protein